VSQSLPRALKWRDFTATLHVLGYEFFANQPGSARNFYNKAKDDLLTVHQPHGSDTIPAGTLIGNYLKQMKVTREEFLTALTAATSSAPAVLVPYDEKFRRTSIGEAGFISHCMRCWNEVGRAADEESMTAVEDTHGCWNTSGAVASDQQTN
jgi:predicted RNA binding protein YcfA (HicA-like mRNA interferase family)